MKKIIFTVLVFIVLLSASGYCADKGNAFIALREKIFAESKELKAFMMQTKDIVLVNSMWDSCIMTMTQLDAYFYLAGISNTIKKKDLSVSAVNYLSNWLNEIKKTTDLNMESLNSVSTTLTEETKVYIQKLNGYFGELKQQVSIELERILKLKESLNPAAK